MNESPSVRLVNFDIPAVVNALSDGSRRKPALLVSFYYLEPFLRNQEKYAYRDWVMDSGAFSAHNSGKAIDLNRYIDTCLELMAKDQTLTEIFSLDVIPADFKPATVARAAEQSERNCEEMWRQGVPVIPCFHRGEPEEFLMRMAEVYPKIALGGVALERGEIKLAWLEQCFARVWPKKIHGFGMSSETIVYSLPFHSVDATNWEIAPCAFGNWQKFGKMSVRGSSQDLRSQVRHYLDMEAKARVRWSREMKTLASLPPSPAALSKPGEHPRAVIAQPAPTAPTKKAKAKKAAKAAPEAPAKLSAELSAEGFVDHFKDRGFSRQADKPQ